MIVDIPASGEQWYGIGSARPAGRWCRAGLTRAGLTRSGWAVVPGRLDPAARGEVTSLCAECRYRAPEHRVAGMPPSDLAGRAHPMTRRPEVLFVCVHNAGRSQIAAALLDHYAAGRVVVRSAGSVPADTINPAAVQVMAEVGVDLSKEFPKPLTTAAVQASDVVITMGCGDACPVFPGKRYLDWDLEDPAGKDAATVRRIRDEIDARVRKLLAEVLR